MNRDLKLNSVDWKEFKISEVFEVSGTITMHPSQLKPNGKTPRITCASTNNALDDTYANSPTEKGKVLTIDSATVGYVSYQENDFIATDHVEKIWIKNNKTMNRYIGLFLKQCIDNAVLLKYGYGYKFSQTRIKKQIVNLPIDSKGQPHWEFMENYMKQIEEKQIQVQVNYIKKNLTQVEQNKIDINSIQWKEFILDNVFIINSTLSGIDKNKLNGKKGNIPYITRTDKQNGIDDFIDNQNLYKINTKGVISIGLDTQTAFWQENDFYTGQNIHTLYNDKLNKYNALFIIILVKRLMEKFSWGSNGATLTRLKRSKTLLPIDSKGQPHWEFMENFMREVEYKKLNLYLDYIKKSKPNL